MKQITSLTLEHKIIHDGKILAFLNGNRSFSDFVNQLIKREVEVEQNKIRSAERASLFYSSLRRVQ